MDRRPVPRFEGSYEVDPKGFVYNIKGHRIKPVLTSCGYAVDLCAYGQRELLLVKDIIKEVYGYGQSKGD